MLIVNDTFFAAHKLGGESVWCLEELLCDQVVIYYTLLGNTLRF